MDAIIGPTWLTRRRRLLRPIAKCFDPMSLQVVGVTWLFLLRMLLIGKRDRWPTVLTVWQYFQNDVDQHIILIIDGTFCAGHPSNSAKITCLDIISRKSQPPSPAPRQDEPRRRHTTVTQRQAPSSSSLTDRGFVISKIFTQNAHCLRC